MNISQIAIALRRFTYHPGAAENSAKEAPEVRESSAGRIQDGQTNSRSAPTDTTEISPEAVFRHAASRYDPEHISLGELRDLVDRLYDGQAISPRDYAILANGPNQESGVSPNAGPEVKRNVVAAWQGQRVHDTARGDIYAVDSGSRALSILGRLVGSTG
jgi:hypothetical protein